MYPITKSKNQGTTIPKRELEAFTETLYPAIKEFFESEQGKAEFKAWQEQQDNKLGITVKGYP